jgi:hypothetical protein
MEFYLHKPGVSLKSIRCQDVFSGTIAPPVALSPPSHVSRECCMVWRTSLYEVAKGLDWIGLDWMRSVSSTKEYPTKNLGIFAIGVMRKKPKPSLCSKLRIGY